MFVEMGEIVNVVGLRGEIKLLVNGNFDPEVLQSPFLRLRSGDAPSRGVCCERSRRKGDTVIVKLAELDDREEAEAAIGSVLGFESADYDLPEFPRGRRLAPFIYHDLRVVTTEGREVGVVDDVLVLPANWVLRVLAPAERGGEREILIPVIEPVIRVVDRAGGRVVIEAMEGLLDEP